MSKNSLNKKQYYEFDEVRMAYWEFGEGSPILFLHGGGTNILGVFPLIQELSKTNKVIAVDLPGHGYSSCSKQVWGLDNYAEFLVHFVEEIGLVNFKVIGHSLGGGIGITLDQKTDSVRKVLAVNPIGLKSSQIFEIRMFKLFVSDPLIGVLKYGMIGIYWNYFLVFIKNLWWQKWNLFRSYRTLKRCVKSGLSDTAIGQNVKVMWGRDDKIFSTNYVQKLRKIMRGSQFEFYEGNHSWLLTKEGMQSVMSEI